MGGIKCREWVWLEERCALAVKSDGGGSIQRPTESMNKEITRRMKSSLHFKRESTPSAQTMAFTYYFPWKGTKIPCRYSWFDVLARNSPYLILSGKKTRGIILKGDQRQLKRGSQWANIGHLSIKKNNNYNGLMHVERDKNPSVYNNIQWQINKPHWSLLEAAGAIQCFKNW